MTTTDWRTMEAGRELDKLIAERLGWRLEERSDKYIRFIVLDPQGRMPGRALPADTPGKAWSYAMLALAGAVPHFSTSVDAALGLIPDDMSFTLHHISDIIRTSGPHFPLKWLADFAGSIYQADTPALALCRVFLAWQDASLATPGDV